MFLKECQEVAESFLGPYKSIKKIVATPRAHRRIEQQLQDLWCDMEGRPRKKSAGSGIDYNDDSRGYREWFEFTREGDCDMKDLAEHFDQAKGEPYTLVFLNKAPSEAKQDLLKLVKSGYNNFDWKVVMIEPRKL